MANQTNTATDKFNSSPIDAISDNDKGFIDDASASNVTKGFEWSQVITYIETKALNLLAGSTIDNKAIKFAGKETIWIPSSAIISATTNGAEREQKETTTNAVNYDVLKFDPSTDEYGHFPVAFPKSWDEGTVTFRAKWEVSSTETNGVAWGLQGVALSDGDAMDTAYGTAGVVTQNANGTANDQLTTNESSAITIAGTPAENDICMFRILRDVSDAGDTLTVDAELQGIVLFFTTNAGNDD